MLSLIYFIPSGQTVSLRIINEKQGYAASEIHSN